MAVGADPFLHVTRSPATGDGPAREGRGIPDLGVRTDGPNPGIFETLTRVTPTFGVGPGLAEGWEQVSPTRRRFRLRAGTTYHDGTAFDAGVVVETLESVARRQHPPRGMEPATPTGTGPFRFASSTAGRELVVRADAEHWGGALELDCGSGWPAL